MEKGLSYQPLEYRDYYTNKMNLQNGSYSIKSEWGANITTTSNDTFIVLYNNKNNQVKVNIIG